MELWNDIPVNVHHVHTDEAAIEKVKVDYKQVIKIRAKAFLAKNKLRKDIKRIKKQLSSYKDINYNLVCNHNEQSEQLNKTLTDLDSAKEELEKCKKGGVTFFVSLAAHDQKRIVFESILLRNTVDIEASRNWNYPGSSYNYSFKLYDQELIDTIKQLLS